MLQRLATPRTRAVLPVSNWGMKSSIVAGVGSGRWLVASTCRTCLKACPILKVRAHVNIQPSDCRFLAPGSLVQRTLRDRTRLHRCERLHLPVRCRPCRVLRRRQGRRPTDRQGRQRENLKMAASGRHQLIAIERPGSSLGEVSAFDGGLYSTTAITIAPTVLLRLHGEHFRNLCLTHPNVALKVIRVLGHRLRHLRRLVEELSFATVRDRLIAHLLRLAA